MAPDADPPPPASRLTARLWRGLPLDDADDGTAPVLRLVCALAGLDAPGAVGLRRCRAPALRYLESLAARGLGRGDALLRVRRLAERWASPGLTPLERLVLDARLRWWIGTVYGERWRGAAAPGARARRSPPGR